MKYLIIIILMITSLSLYSNDAIIIHKKPDNIKLSVDTGKTWHLFKLFSNTIIINKLSGESKISNDYGFNWEYNKTINNEEIQTYSYLINESIFSLNFYNHNIDNLNLTLFDLNGKIHEINYYVSHDNIVTINFDKKKSGIYFIRSNNKTNNIINFIIMYYN